MSKNTVMVRPQSAIQSPLDPDALVKRAQLVIDAGLAPESYLKDVKGAQKLALIAMKGMDMGMSFMEAINSFYVVKGRIGEMTHQLVLGLREHGHDYVIDESTPDRCSVTFYGRDGRDRPPFTMTFDDCEKAGWTKDSGGTKPLYNNPTGRTIMLRYRTISNGIRAYFPEVVHKAVPQIGVSAPDDDGDDTEGSEFVDTETGEIIEGHATVVPTQAQPESPPAEPLGRALQGEPHWATLPSNRRTLAVKRDRLTLSNDEVMTALGEDLGQPIQRLSEYPFDLTRACKALEDYVTRRAGGATQPELPV